MKAIKIIALAAIVAGSMSGAAVAAGANDAAGRANTTDPNSAPIARDVGRKASPNDAAGRANTADPNSAPIARDSGRKASPNDAAGRANTKDPNSATTGGR